MNDNEHNLDKKPENPYISSQEPQDSYQGQNINPNQGQYPNTQYTNGQYPNAQYPNGAGQFIPQQQTGGMTNGIWSMIMLGGTVVFTFALPLMCILTAIGGVIFGHIGWKNSKETLARIGFWLNLGTIILGGFITLLLLLFLGTLFAVGSSGGY